MRFFPLFALLFGGLALPVWADPPWRGEADQSVLLQDFPAAVRFEGRAGPRRVEIEELDRRGDLQTVRFTLLDGPGRRAPILAYLEVTVRSRGPEQEVRIEMMQSYGAPAEGTMSDLCRAAAQHSIFKQATDLSAYLDFTNDDAFRTALREGGQKPALAFRSKVWRDERERSAIPLARHLEILSGGDFQITTLDEMETRGKPRYRVVVRPLGRLQLLDGIPVRGRSTASLPSGWPPNGYPFVFTPSAAKDARISSRLSP